MASTPTSNLIQYVKCILSPLVGREVFNFVQVVTDKVMINNVGSAIKKDLVLYAKAHGEAQPTKVVWKIMSLLTSLILMVKRRFRLLLS